jgi:hypothetical protein
MNAKDHPPSEARCLRMGCRSSGTAPKLVDGICPKCGTRQQYNANPFAQDRSAMNARALTWLAPGKLPA